MFIDGRFRTVRKWSNLELKKIAPLFTGDIVNVSAWDDRDKEGSYYKKYFINAGGYYYTNYSGDRGYQKMDNEFLLDLTGEMPVNLVKRFDVAFNHTTLEHIFDVRKAMRNLCSLTKDVVIIIVPFSQVQHGENEDWKDYWRFTPTCMRALLTENGFKPIYEAESSKRNASIYLLFVAAREPEKWQGRLPEYVPIKKAGSWIGRKRIIEFIKVWYNRFVRVTKRK